MVPGGAARRPSGTLEHLRQIARVEVIEHDPRALIERVGIDALGFEQLDPALPFGALLLELVELFTQRNKLLVEVLLGPQPVIAGVGVDAEIADHQRTADIKTERGQKEMKLSPRDHAGKMR